MTYWLVYNIKNDNFLSFEFNFVKIENYRISLFTINQQSFSIIIIVQARIFQ